MPNPVSKTSLNVSFSGATLRKKVMGLVGITLLAVLVFTAGFNVFLSSRHYDNYEIEQIKRNTLRAQHAIEQELYHLDIFLNDWSAWDDTYRFIQDRNDAYLKANLLDNTFMTSKLNLMAFLDSSHHAVYIKLYDLVEEKEISYTELFPDSVTDFSQRIGFSDPDSLKNGIYCYSNRIMLLAARPIVKTDQTGPVLGTLIIGRVVDEKMLQELSRNLELSLRLLQLSNPKTTAEERAIFSQTQQSGEPLTKFDNSSIASGYVLIKDVWGDANILLEVKLPRDLKTLRTDEFVTSMLLLVAIAAMCIVLIAILSKTVLGRVELLSKQVSQIGSSSDSKHATAIAGNDELSGLSVEINRMLSRLQTTTDNLRESEKRFRDILSNVQLLGFILDAKGRVKFCNRYLLTTTGYHADELLDHDWFEIMPPEELRRQRRENYFEQMRTGHLTTTSTHDIVTKSGSHRTVSFNITPLHDAQGDPNGIAVIGEDITERLRIERENNRLVTLVESATEAITLFDTENRILYVNPAFEKMYKYHEEDVLFKSTLIFMADVNHTTAASVMMEHLKRGNIWRCRELNTRGDGSMIEVDVTVVPVRDIGGNILYFGRFARDVSQEVELQNQLNQAQRLVAIGELTGGIAHNFNNLLTAIIGNIGLAKSHTKGIAIDYLSDAENASYRAADLVKQLMTFSRKSRMSKTPIDVNQLIQEAGRLVRSTFDRRIEVVVNDSDVTKMISGDANQLQQVLLNMCFNSRDALMEVATDPERRITIVLSAAEVQITDRLIEAELRSGDFICISVSDTGKGMTPEVIKQVFEPFYTTKEVGSGTGLGLSTAFGIVRQHDGWITVYSEPEIGSTFRIYLPAVNEEGNRIEQGVIEKTALPRGNELLLLVDDEAMIRQIGQTMLEKLGYRIAVAGNGKEALELYERMPDEYGLILLDLSMPVMSGREFLERCRRLQHRPKIIVSSGISTNTLGAELLALVDGFVTKPYSMSDLALTVRSVLDEPRIV